MAKMLTIEIADSMYASLMQVATKIGQTPEQVILQWIENRIAPPHEDPLLALGGIFEAPETNISADHDRYLGDSIKDDHA